MTSTLSAARQRSTATSTPLMLCAVSLVAASLVHFAVMPDHFSVSVLYGGFFLVTATLQILVAGRLLRRPSRGLVVAVVASSAWVVVLWAWTRLIGVPIGPDNGATESVGLLDTVASLAELATVGCGLLALRGDCTTAVDHPRRWPVATQVASVAGVVAVAVVCLVSSRS